MSNYGKGCFNITPAGNVRYRFKYIEFKGIGRGIINVSGHLNNHNRSGYEQELKFENEFDQTYLKTIANRVVQDVRL